ncbi:MAG: alpha/beta hydrolase fold domain-containing protein [Oscillospiraceae bacterium]
MKPNHNLSDEFLNSGYRKYFDLAYGNVSNDQKLDLWLPDEPASGPYPVILYFHGGGFRGGAKRENQSEPALRALERGYAVADVDYRKSGEAIFPAMLQDAKAAVRFLRANAAQYDLDGARFAAWGASCGGWIVSMLGVTSGRTEFDEAGRTNPEQSDAVQAVVDWCGPCGNFLLTDPDLEESGVGEPNHTAADSMEGLFMGGCLTEMPERCRLAAPGTYVCSDMPPVLIVHGKLDPVVAVQQSRRFYEEIVRAAGADRVEYRELEGVGHHSKPWNDDPAIAKITMDFLERAVK